jgi:hypothetical protein
MSLSNHLGARNDEDRCESNENRCESAKDV